MTGSLPILPRPSIMESDRLGDQSLGQIELRQSACSDSAGNAMAPQVCSSGIDFKRTAISEWKLLSPFDETKKPNSGQSSLLPDDSEVSFMTSSVRGTQKFEGCCKVGEDTGSQGGVSNGERSTASVTLDEREEQDYTEAVEDLGQQIETLQLRKSPDSSRTIVNSPVSESVGELVSGENKRTNHITLSSKRYSITATDLSKALESLETDHIIQKVSSSWALRLPVPSRSWLMEALVKQQQEAGPVHVWVTGHGSPQTNPSEVGDRDPGRDLAEYLSSLEDHSDIPDLLVGILKEKGYPTPGDPGWQSWFHELQRIHHTAPLLPPQDLIPTNLPLIPPDFDDLLFKGVDDDLISYQELQLLDVDLQGVENTPVPQPVQPAFDNTTNNLIHQETGSVQNDNDFVSFAELLDLGLPVMDGIFMSQPVHDQANDDIIYTTNDKPESGLIDNDFVTFGELLGLEFQGAQDPDMPSQLQAIDNTTNTLPESGPNSSDVFASLEAFPDPDAEYVQELVPLPSNSPTREFNTTTSSRPHDHGVEYQEIAQNARETLQSYQAEIFTWMKNLTAMQNRPTWWDQPDHGERLVGIFQELQTQSVKAFAQVDAAPGARTRPSSDHELALQQQQERPPSPDVWRDVYSMWQIVDYLHDIRRAPPQFHDAQSRDQFLELVGTFYSVLVRTIEKMYGDGAKEVLIDELLQFRDQLPRQTTEPSHHVQQEVGVDADNVNPPRDTPPRVQPRKRNRDEDPTTYQRTKKAAHDRQQPGPPGTGPGIDLQNSGAAEKLMASTLVKWMKGLYVMRSKATRVTEVEHPLTAVLLAPQLQAFHQKVLISAEGNFDASVDDVTEAKRQSARKDYTRMITEDPEVMGQISKETTDDLDYLFMNDKGKLISWTAQYLTTATELRKLAKNSDPVVRRERSALLRTFLDEIGDTARSLLDPGVAEKTLHIGESKLSVARDATARRYGYLPPRQHDEAGSSRGFPEPGDTPTSLQPTDQLLEPPDSERLRMSETQQRKAISDGWESEWPFAQSIAIPVDFTRADFDHYEHYLLLTYKELKRLMLEMVVVTLGKRGFENMHPDAVRDLEFYITAYYRFAAGQVDHADPLCPRTSPPLQCCYTRKFGTSFLEPDPEKRHKLILTNFIRDVYGRLIRYTDGSLSKMPDVILKQLKNWVAAHGYDTTRNIKMRKLSEETGLPKRQLVAWINREKLENNLAVEAATPVQAPTVGMSTLAASRDLPVDINHRTSVSGQPRRILTHWLEQHREYPIPIDSEERELTRLTNLERTMVHRFISTYRSNNRHRMNVRAVPKIHREMNELGHGGNFGPRFLLVGAPIEVPDEDPQEGGPPAPIPRTGATGHEGERFDSEQEIDTQVGILNDEEPRNKAAQEEEEAGGAQEAGEDEGEEDIDFEREADIQLDILNDVVAEGGMTFEEAEAVVAEAREGEAADLDDDDEPEDPGPDDVVIDEGAANLLPEITDDPGLNQRMRKKMMIGGLGYTGKRWIPSPEIQNSPFDLMGRAKEQMQHNCLKILARTLEKMNAEINCLIAAHENFANGVRVHCKPNCNPAVDPHQCCFYERFGMIDHISGPQARMVASLPSFDAAIARLNFTLLNEEEKSWKKWAIPFSAALEIEKWITEQRKMNTRVLKPRKQQLLLWEKFIGIPQKQVTAFIQTYRKKCLETLHLPTADRQGVIYLRQWFEENRLDPYMDIETAAPICQQLNLSYERLQVILCNVRKENAHRIIERFSLGKSRRCRYGPRTEDGRTRLSYKL